LKQGDQMAANLGNLPHHTFGKAGGAYFTSHTLLFSAPLPKTKICFIFFEKKIQNESSL
jgi:hypothetical protein